MASEQVSLCWDNFHKSMCSGMSSLLKNEDLVDVTIAVEGRYFKAHKMVLSLCSPYFRELFKVNPCKHPIFFMKDVSYTVMSDLLQFMYNGEVQVLQENLSTFRKTAEALQVTGLTAAENLSRKAVQRIENEKGDAPASPKIEQSDTAADPQGLVLVKVEPHDDPASNTLADDEFDEDPLYDENIDDFTEEFYDHSMIEEAESSAESKPGTSADISISPTCIANDTQDVAKRLQDKPLPEKSKKVYMKMYSAFKDWCQEKCVSQVTENDLLLYFHEKAENRKASSLWAIFSMLKQTLKLKENINITKYYKVIAFLKKKNISYTPKQAAVFKREQITKFITEAPDDSFLSTKVILIVGIAGAYRTDELCNMKVSDIDVQKDRILINIPRSKTRSDRMFAIEDSLWVDVLKRYLAKRPAPDMERLFIGFRFGKPTRQNMGHNTISNTANRIAKYLKLPNVDSYSGYKETQQSELTLIPEKSKTAYYKEYEKFMAWMASTSSSTVDETVMLTYMHKMSDMSYQWSTLWCIFSKLQTMLKIKQGVNIGSFLNLRAFMKGLNKGQPKKSLVFTEDQLRKFFIQAPDEAFLSLKVLVICGIFGSCRRFEMCDLRMSDIKTHDATLIITIRPTTKTEKCRRFAVVNDSDILYFDLFKKYLKLRPDNLNTDRVFLKYVNGKCFRQVVGINTIGKCPSMVARYLNLPDASKYTGHAFRRTSVSILANSGMSAKRLKHQVGLKSSAFANRYIREFTANKLRVSKRIAESAASTSSTINTIFINENSDDEVQCLNGKDKD